eukprot:1927169-Rhodomonas_salina.2
MLAERDRNAGGANWTKTAVSAWRLEKPRVLSQVGLGLGLGLGVGVGVGVVVVGVVVVVVVVVAGAGAGAGAGGYSPGWWWWSCMVFNVVLCYAVSSVIKPGKCCADTRALLVRLSLRVAVRLSLSLCAELHHVRRPQRALGHQEHARHHLQGHTYTSKIS